MAFVEPGNVRMETANQTCPVTVRAVGYPLPNPLHETVSRFAKPVEITGYQFLVKELFQGRHGLWDRFLKKGLFNGPEVKIAYLMVELIEYLVAKNKMFWLLQPGPNLRNSMEDCAELDVVTRHWNLARKTDQY